MTSKSFQKLNATLKGDESDIMEYSATLADGELPQDSLNGTLSIAEEMLGDKPDTDDGNFLEDKS